MVHRTERSFEDVVEQWFIDEYGEENVERQVYQSEPRWFCDLVVELPYATLYIELESRASEIRPGVAQAMGYSAAQNRSGLPMVIIPANHFLDVKVERISLTNTVAIVEFDDEKECFVNNR